MQNGKKVKIGRILAGNGKQYTKNVTNQISRQPPVDKKI
jgi:hypothetical protein